MNLRNLDKKISITYWGQASMAHAIASWRQLMEVCRTFSYNLEKIGRGVLRNTFER
jgi:hypothetical protein